MKYIEFRFDKPAGETESAILMMQLEEIGFEGFIEEEGNLTGYILCENFRGNDLKTLPFLKNHPEINYSSIILEDKNWNEEWEKNYPPVVIAGKCYIHAPFHPPRPDLPFEILIVPRMSFGTAHHETTALMIEWMLKIDMKNKQVLDMGCGTGILAILANKKGASGVLAIDDDEWAFRNALDNFRLNNVHNCKVLMGDASVIPDEKFDIILANINRNILIQDIPRYAAALGRHGILLLSGFYGADEAAIIRSAGIQGIKYAGRKSKGSWAAILFNRN
jgi:ribosomal protein L11 methyltransferase